MPIKKIDLNTLLKLPLPKLPYQDEFIVWLYNNNYSPLTIYNYLRDITFFALFLQQLRVDFKDINKKHVVLYKGWLKDRMHIITLRKYLGVDLDSQEPLNTKISWKYKKHDFSGKTEQGGSNSLDKNRVGSDASTEYNSILYSVDQPQKNDKNPANPLTNKEYSQLLEEVEDLGQGNKEDSNKKKDSSTLSLDIPEDQKQALQKLFGRTIRGNYAKDHNPKELDSASINRMLSALRQYLRFLVENDYFAPISADAVSLVKQSKKMPKVPSLEELLKLIEAPTQLEKDQFIALRNRAMLEVLLATGMRISELLSLNRDQINHEGKMYITGKGRKQRIVYLTPRALEHVLNYLKLRKDPYKALFIPKRALQGRSKSNDPRVSANYLQAKIVEYRQALGLVFPITAHTIRHAFATYMVERGANPAILQRLLGHESLHTTTKYVHASDIVAEKEHAKFHPVKN